MYNLNEMIQGSEEWLEWRSDKITATASCAVMGVSGWQTLDQLYQEKVGLSQPQLKNWAMQRGLEMEPAARKAFKVFIDDDVFPELRVHPSTPWMVASLDGVNLDGSVVVEIKCPGKKDHDTALSGKVPAKYYPQLQHQMIVCDVQYMWYFSYRSDDDCVGILVDRCNDYCNELISRETAFYEFFNRGIKPIKGLWTELDELVEKIETEND